MVHVSCDSKRDPEGASSGADGRSSRPDSFHERTSREPKGRSSADSKDIRSFDGGLADYSELLAKGVPVGEEALWLETLLERFGPGSDRDRLIEELFRNSSPVAGLGLLASVPAGSSKGAAEIGLACRISVEPVATFVSNLATLNRVLSNQETNVVVSALSMRIDPELTSRIFGLEMQHSGKEGRSQRFQESLDALKRLESTGVLGGKEGRFDVFFENAILTAPFDVWKSLSDGEFLEGLSKESLDRKHGELIDAMVMANPQAAISSLMESAGDEAALGRAAVAWLKKDSTAFEQWFESNRRTMAVEAVNGISASLADEYSKRGNIKEARQWLADISDPDVKRKVEGQVWGRERDQLRKDVGKAPRQTVDKLIDGTASYDAYWIEEAVATWVSKDFDGAIAWYEEKWKSLPPSKAQYVAAAFATQSVSQKDFDAARQWADLIQDAKTRERINAAIAKASGAK